MKHLKINLITIVIFTLISSLKAQDPVIMKINDRPIKKSEFEAVYRKNNGGMSFTDGKQDADFLYNRIGMYKGIDAELDYKFHKTIQKNIARYYLMLANSIQYGDNFLKSRYFALKSLHLSKPNTNEHLKNVVQKFILPRGFMKIYANLKWQIEKLIDIKKASQ